MTPLIEVSESVLKTLNPKDYTRRADLENILKKDESGKPILRLIPLERTAVNTKTQEEYNELMKIYEAGNWFWYGGSKPTNLNLWYIHKAQTCLEAKETFLHKYKDIQLKEDCNVLSTQKFYKSQKITPEMLKEINEYFEGRK